ncbi:MAG: HNH endonuclease [Moorea sp. SIO2I5]|nr:HNH endonuclease [Moorena sp. SIO2I5]
MPIPKQLYQQLRKRAVFQCEYCHYPEILSNAPLSVDHLWPKSLGGSDRLDNLALACRRCNERRYNFTTGIDPDTGNEVPLFNPRLQSWSDHFIWTADGLSIIGTSPTGRATCARLDLNDERRSEKFIVKSRRLWVKGGLHPPLEDPRQSV